MNVEDIQLNDLLAEAEGFTMDRRDFLKTLGGGILILFSIGNLEGAQKGGRRRISYPEDLNAYLLIDNYGMVHCFTGKVEMGQGIMTSLAQMLAEELDAPLEAIKMVMGDTSQCPWDMGTFGSMTTKYFGPALRQAGAAARETLLQLASDHFQVPPEQLTTQGGTVFVTEDPKQKVLYAHLTKGKQIQRKVTGKPTLKPRSKYTISGRQPNRLDLLEKVMGKAQYAGDIRVPGMLYARLLRPPAHGAQLKSVNLDAVRNMKGVRVVRDKDLVAVLHEEPDMADRALGLIKAEFTPPPADDPKQQVDNRGIFDYLRNVKHGGEDVYKEGDLAKGASMATKTVEARFFNHYVAHAPIETHTALAKIEKDNKEHDVTVWASTQTPFRAQDQVAEALGVPKKKVRVITPYVGGGFGGKSDNRQVVEAARLAKLTGKPVQVAWSRSEEFFLDRFRPAAVIDVKSGLSDTNEIVHWDFAIHFAGSRSSRPLYNIPHYRVFSRGSWGRGGGVSPHPFSVGAWRGPGSNTNVFAMESHMDMLAEKAGMDPLSFRLHNLKDQRMIKVLKRASRKFRRSFSPLPGGKGYGVACSDYNGTYVAAMAEVEVDRATGVIRVKRVVCAQDMGEIINPQIAMTQIEGSVIMGLGYVLSEEVKFKGGQIHDRNFDTYDIARFSQTPHIQVQLVRNPGLAAQGCGEPPITLMGAVIANAVYDAVGVRLYELPMTPERVKAALEQKKTG